MLKESTKKIVAAFIIDCQHMVCGADRYDPAEIVRGIIIGNNPQPECREAAADVAANRDEAEQFVAGIMGLM